MIKPLLEYGAKLDTQDSKGDTPYHCLVSRKASTKDDIEGQIQLARRLLDNMEDLDTISHDGLTALSMSLITSGQEKLSLLLIEYGSRLLISKPDFQLALHVEQIAGRAASSCSIHETSGPDNRVHEISI